MPPSSLNAHHVYYSLLLASIFPISFSTSIGDCSDLPGIGLEQSAIKARKQIISAKIDLDIQVAIPGDGNSQLLSIDDGVYYVRKVLLWVDGDSCRFDHSIPVANNIFNNKDDVSSNSTTDGMSRIRVISTPRENLVQDSTRFEGVPPIALSVSENPKKAGGERFKFDFRCIGMIPTPFTLMGSAQLEQFYGNPERHNSEVSEEILDGTKTIKTTYVRDDGLKISAWIVPEKGNSIVRAETLRVTKMGIKYLQLITCDLNYYSESTWFPSRIDFTRFKEETVSEQERILVRAAEFNHPIDPVVFTIAGLELRPGTHVVNKAATNTSINVKSWDGEKLIEPTNTGLKTTIETNERGKVFYRVIWILNLTIVGIVLLFWTYRRYRIRLSKSEV